MEPIQVAAFQHVTTRNLDEREIQHRLELRFAQREERRRSRQLLSQQLVQRLGRWRHRRPAAITLAPGVVAE